MPSERAAIVSNGHGTSGLGVLSLDADFRGKGLPERPLVGRLRAGEELTRVYPGVRTMVMYDREGDNWDLLTAGKSGNPKTRLTN